MIGGCGRVNSVYIYEHDLKLLNELWYCRRISNMNSNTEIYTLVVFQWYKVILYSNWRIAPLLHYQFICIPCLWAYLVLRLAPSHPSFKRSINACDDDDNGLFQRICRFGITCVCNPNHSNPCYRQAYQRRVCWNHQTSLGTSNSSNTLLCVWVWLCGKFQLFPVPHFQKCSTTI